MPYFTPTLIPPKGQMMGMVSWQGTFPNFTQSISCQSSLTQLDLMIEVGFKFTTSVVDNIDHNPTATTTKTSFHGTSISIFQHPSSELLGEEREPIKLNADVKAKKVTELPDAFTNVRPAFITKNQNPPTAGSLPYPAPESIWSHLKEEYAWLEKVSLSQSVGDAISITWTSHHATQKRSQPFEVSITSLLPLLRDHTHSVATLKHAMRKIRDTVAFLNPGQTPVIAAKQSLYALLKQIQWEWPEYGEDKFVIMFGGLHIEMAALKSLGTLLEDCGWTSAIIEAGLASSGTAESFLTASSVTKTRQAHQITACTLYKLMRGAYDNYCSEDSSKLTLKNSVTSGCMRVHSSSSGIWCWIWSSSYSH